MSIELERHHPDVHRPWAAWSEEQTLHLVLVYTNPFRWETRRKLFNDALRHFLGAPNVRVYVVELAYGDRPFEVTTPDHHIPQLTAVQLRTDCEMFHKENLVNIGVRHFPQGWMYGGYWDADFHCTRHDWALEAIHLLQHYHFVQLFSSYSDLTAETATSWMGHRPWRITSSFAWNFLHQDEFHKSALKGKAADSSYGPLLPNAGAFPYGFSPGATGGGWAWRRPAFDTVGGLLDTCPLGSADWHMAFGLAGLTNVAAELKRCTQPYIRNVLQWQERAQKLASHPGKSNIGCVDQFVTHAFHGSRSKRQYGERWHILLKHQFDPITDLTRDWQGVWRWTGNKPGLRDDVRRYFLTRAEDHPDLYGKEAPLV
ncbi:MAG TPA: hypothetical protein VKV17_12815 [Bryobacteraceae bacterium]|nr:hypothetical protein [Bryobacteraceae bacterium]